MEKEITNKQLITLMTLFLFGSSLVLGIGGNVKQDAWISVIFGTLFALPILIIYTYIINNLEKDFFDTMKDTFGKIIGNVIIILYTWYALHLGSLVLRNFTEFIQIVALPDTPMYIFVMFMGVTAIYMVKCGIEVMGRWSEFVLPLIIFIIVINYLLSINNLDFMNLYPILYNGLKPVISGGFNVFSFPIAETVLFIAIFPINKVKISSRKVYFFSVVISSTILLISTLRNILILGAKNASNLFFPSHSAVRLIDVGTFLERIEINMGTIFILSGLIKLSVCLLVASKGITKLFNFSNYKLVTSPVGLLMFTLTCIIYTSTNEMFEWLKIYSYYAIPFQLIIPIIIFSSLKFKNINSVKS